MPPREMILSATPTRMQKLAQYGEHVPIKIRGGGKEYHAVMVNPAHMHGGTLSLAGAGQCGGKFGKGTWKKIEWPGVPPFLRILPSFRRPGKRPKTQTTDTAACAIKNCTGLHLKILVYDLNSDR